jgi:PHS family inorganic phosphate transporter-like MFS transporter
MSNKSSLRRNVKLVLKLGAGFFADAYDLFVIDIVLSILEQESLVDPSGLDFTTFSKSVIASATSIGAVVGMILFGLIGDYVGRRRGVLITGSLVAIGSLLSAACVRSSSVPLMTQLAIYRTLLGVGIGGEYPLSATMASEGSDAKVRGRIIAGVFSMQGVGMLFSSLLGYILIVCGASLEFTWRFLLAFGAFPALVALWFRLKMKEDTVSHVQNDVPKYCVVENQVKPESPFPTSPNASPVYRSKWEQSLAIIKQNKIQLIATCLSWFLLDVTFYGTGEFKHAVAHELFPADPSATSAEIVANGALFGIIISCIALPGYICACIFIDTIGRWRLQVGGFIAMTVLYVVMAIAIKFEAPSGINLFIFGLTFFFTNFGPNTTTFIIPSEIYPHAVRATCHGLSAASGKAGAITGSAGFPPSIAALGLDGVMYICAAIAASGFGVTWGLLDKKLVDAAAARPQENKYVANSDIEIAGIKRNDSISESTSNSSPREEILV